MPNLNFLIRTRIGKFNIVDFDGTKSEENWCYRGAKGRVHEEA